MRKRRFFVVLCLLAAMLLLNLGDLEPDPVQARQEPLPIPTNLPPIAALAGARWIVEIDVPQSMGIVSSAADLQNQVRGLMPAGTPVMVEVSSGSSPNGPVYTIRITGSNTDILRLIIFELLSPIVDVSSLPIAWTLEGAVTRGASLAVFFSGIPSTGYQYIVDGLGNLFRLESSGYECEDVGPGGQNSQTILLEALQNGSAALKFFYQRGWEEVLQYYPVRITIEAGDLQGTFDLSDLTMQALALPEVAGQPLVGAGLPASFDWSTSNNYTGAPQMSAVKNQGSCGSCWAFATVGVMEGVLMIKGQGEQDLAEQYLVSCNTDGWSCNGGWDVHEYHINKPGAASNQPGAVLESSMPYTASNGTCSTISNHPYKLATRHDVANTVESLKAALYNYGPVWTTICADPLMNYRGGIITTANCNRVDHAVVLVGWDDSTESWMVKNSWGAGWGENGYFRIKWGVSGIGQYSNYVTYDGDGVAPKDITPTPTLTVTVEPDVTQLPEATATPTPEPDDQAATRTPRPPQPDEEEEEDDALPLITPSPRVVGPGFYDDNQLDVFGYGGQWFLYQSPKPFRETTHFSYQSGSQARFRFDGMRVSIAFTTNPDQGVMKVEIDRTMVFYVNQYHTSQEWRRLWQSPKMNAGVHEVLITHVGERQIDLDYIVVE